MKHDFEKFKKDAALLKLEITDDMEEKFSRYYDLLIEWNKVMNLTAVTDFNDAAEKHFLDSISLGNAIHLEERWKLIDIGTGAGFPGVPLKIVFPDLEIVLADSLNKRVRFLNEVIHQLHLENICAVHGRAEDLARNAEYREQFDICVSRAVANLSTLSEYCIPFVKPGGKFISYKSGKIEKEVEDAEKAVQLLGGQRIEVKKFQLPGTDYQRSFLMVEKVKKTPKKYPRKTGIPSKQPLGAVLSSVVDKEC